MPKAPPLTQDQKLELLDKTAKMRAEDPKITQEEIGKQIGQSRQTISNIMSDERYRAHMEKYKKKIDTTNSKTMDLASKQLWQQVKQGKIKAYQLIGLLKVIGELSYPNLNPLIGGNNSTVNVQIVRNGETHSDNKEEVVPK